MEHLESEYLGPRALALWFSRPDEDNWFSFEKATEAAALPIESRIIRVRFSKCVARVLVNKMPTSIERVPRDMKTLVLSKSRPKS